MASTKKNIALAVTACALWGTAAAEPGITANEIVLGQAAGFTVAGTVKELTAGAKAYFDRVNASGGVHGRKIVLESLDDGFDPKRTPETVRKLIAEKKCSRCSSRAARRPTRRPIRCSRK
jgi:ABC-type branched-subunit amino acid transport system substrate-binding protein